MANVVNETYQREDGQSSAGPHDIRGQSGSDAHAEKGSSTTSLPNMRRRILCAICINLVVQIMVAKVLQQNQAAMVTVANCMTMMNWVVQDKRIFRLDGRSVWRLNRTTNFLEKSLMNAHSENEFTRRLRVKRNTFFYICSLVAPIMQKSNKGGSIPLETRVAVALNRLGTGNYLLATVDLFGVSEGLACIIVQDFCRAVMKYIRPLVVPKWTKESLPRIAAEFEAKQGIPFIMGAIDGSHIPIIAPRGDPAPFYNRKGFYSVLLQGIVDVNTLFMDWDFGWAGSLHDYTLFVNSKEGTLVTTGHYLPYKLIGDAAYPFRSFMYVPFKGTKEQLDPTRAHWNFIQSSTRMCVECAFGMLKGRWRILLRRLEMNLENLPDVVGACICLHNLCIMQKDFGDERLVQEAKQWLKKKQLESFGDLRHAGTFKVFEYGDAELNRLEIDVEGLIAQGVVLPHEEYQPDVLAEKVNEVEALKNGMTMHTLLAQSLFEEHLRRDVPLIPGRVCDEDSRSSSSGDD